MTRRQTFQILSCEDNRSQVMIFNEALDLRGDFSAIPSHNQSLTDRPAKNDYMLVPCLPFQYSDSLGFKQVHVHGERLRFRTVNR